MKAMKAMKAMNAMKKGALLNAIATANEIKTKEVSHFLDALVGIATKEVKKAGVFTIHGLCRIKTRFKPATKACVKEFFGEKRKVKAKPARTIVKAFPVAALKQQI